MRRTGSEEIGFKQSPRPAGITSGVPRVLPLADFFGEAPERRPWIKEHDDAGRTLPGFIFAFVFYWLDLPTDCAIEPSFFSRNSSAPASAFPVQLLRFPWSSISEHNGRKSTSSGRAAGTGRLAPYRMSRWSGTSGFQP